MIVLACMLPKISRNMPVCVPQHYGLYKTGQVCLKGACIVGEKDKTIHMHA